MSEIAGRIKKIRKTLDLTQLELAEELGLTQSAYSRIEVGGNNLSTDHLLKMLKNHKVNPNWVLTGQGQMFLDPSPATIHNSVVGHGNLVVKDGINTVASSDGRSDCAEIKKQLQEAREEIIRLKGQVELLKELLSKKH